MKRFVSTLGIFILPVLLIVVLAFGNIAHVFIPHDHATHGISTDLLHSAVRHEDKQLMLVPALTVLFAVIAIAVVSVVLSGRQLTLLTLRVRSQETSSLRRGIARYRKFR